MIMMLTTTTNDNDKQKQNNNDNIDDDETLEPSLLHPIAVGGTSCCQGLVLAARRGWLSVFNNLLTKSILVRYLPCTIWFDPSIF